VVDPFSLAVAIGSFVISIVTLYLTYIQKGKLRLTRPTAIFFVRDGADGKFKIVVTALLYSTAK
jgi:E3 ubiquitin-protein ligase DOA10